MSDMPPMQELSNERLRELAEMAAVHDPNAMHKAQQARERDAVLAVINPNPPAPADPIGAAKEKIAELEAKLASPKFNPTGRAASDPQHMKNLQAITYIEGDLHWERRHLADLESAERSREDRRALAGASRLFEIACEHDGRKMRQSAPDAVTLQKRLEHGYTVTGEVFIGGYVKRLDAPNAAFDGWIEAHGEELCTYLAEREFTIRRDNAA
jgi:hypothetical protein